MRSLNSRLWPTHVCRSPGCDFTINKRGRREKWQRRQEVETHSSNNKTWTHHRGQPTSSLFLPCPPCNAAACSESSDIHPGLNRNPPGGTWQTDWLCMVSSSLSQTHTRTDIHIYRQYRNRPRLGYYHTHSCMQQLIPRCFYMALAHANIQRQKKLLLPLSDFPDC